VRIARAVAAQCVTQPSWSRPGASGPRRGRPGTSHGIDPFRCLCSGQSTMPLTLWSRQWELEPFPGSSPVAWVNCFSANCLLGQLFLWPNCFSGRSLAHPWPISGPSLAMSWRTSMSPLRPPTLGVTTHEACQPSALDIDGIILRREGEAGCTEPPHGAQLVDWHHPTMSRQTVVRHTCVNGPLCGNVCAPNLGPPSLDRRQAGRILHRAHLLGAIKRVGGSHWRGNRYLPQCACIVGGTDPVRSTARQRAPSRLC
jgi:hypothetical protein